MSFQDVIPQHQTPTERGLTHDSVCGAGHNLNTLTVPTLSSVRPFKRNPFFFSFGYARRRRHSVDPRGEAGVESSDCVSLLLAAWTVSQERPERESLTANVYLWQSL